MTSKENELQKEIADLEDLARCKEEAMRRKDTIIERLEQENKELKEKLKVAETFNLDLQNAEAEAVTECAKYKQALEEIRGICKNVAFSNSCDNCDGIGYYEGGLDDDCGNYACFEVLDKINEVLND